jgi:hypothetical protein
LVFYKINAFIIKKINKNVINGALKMIMSLKIVQMLELTNRKFELITTPIA